MKITIEVDTRDNEYSEELFIDGRSVCNVGPLWECPEDAIIGRALISCTEIVAFMRLAYEAGRRGEDFDVTTV